MILEWDVAEVLGYDRTYEDVEAHQQLFTLKVK